MEPKAPSSRRFYWLTACCALFLTALRLYLAHVYPLSFDEAYYWRWSRALGMSFTDHPPMVAWLIRAGTILLGDSPLGVRFWSVILGGGGFLLTVAISRKVGLSQKQSLIASLVATLLPTVSAGSLLATPDIPLGACWLLATWALLNHQGNRLLYWSAVLSAIALYAKLSALLIPGLVAVVMLRDSKLKTTLASRHFWSALALFVALTAPFWFASAQHSSNPISFQAARLSGTWSPLSHLPWAVRTPIHLLELIGGYVGLLNPFIAVGFLAALYFKNPSSPIRTCMDSVLIPLGAAGLAALFTHPEQNWAALGHPVAVVVAFKAMSGSSSGRLGQLVQSPAWLPLTIGSTLAVSLVIHLHTANPMLPLNPSKDPTSKMHGWSELKGLAAAQNLPIQGVFCDNYGLASQFEWHNRDILSPPVLSPDRPAPPLPQGLWLVLDEHDDIDHIDSHPACESLKSLPAVVLKNSRGHKIREIDARIGFGCKYAPAR